MDLRLIHADGEMRELGEVTEFESFCARLALGSEECDWELTLPEGVWSACPAPPGHFVYIDGSEWGGPVERVRHIGSQGLVRLYGTCWRGLLKRRVVAPMQGQTHVSLTGQEANAAIAALLGGWREGLFVASQEDSGLCCTAEVRYRPLLDALDEMLADAGGRLSAVFSGGCVTLRALPSQVMTDRVELSQEYDARIISDRCAPLYDHILALGRGEMLERQVVEMWLLPDGSVTEDAESETVAALSDTGTLLYDYSAVESLEELRRYARRRLLGQAAADSLTIELTDDAGLELTDTAAVRDAVTGMSALLRVIEKELSITQDGAVITHRLADSAAR